MLKLRAPPCLGSRRSGFCQIGRRVRRLNEVSDCALGAPAINRSTDRCGSVRAADPEKTLPRDWLVRVCRVRLANS